jgi:tRNA threonylcarbamoyladenosine biosynthesis protein TsaE
MNRGAARWSDHLLRLPGAVLIGAYELLFGWWLNGLLARRYEKQLARDVHDAMPFLFDEFGGRIVPSLGVPFPPAFDYAFVTVAIENLLIRFCRGRGEFDLQIAAADAPRELRELGLLLDVLGENDGARRRGTADLWQAARLLQPEMNRLIGAFNPNSRQDLKERIAEADASGTAAMLQRGMRIAYVTSSEEETVEVGRKIARILPKRACVLLIGNLGAGKTTLAKGLIQGLGVARLEEVVSPTFTLIHEYGGGRVYHIDLYRLDKPEQVATLGLDDIFDKDAVVFIEWGERFPELMPRARFEIRLTAIGEDERQIETKSVL